MPFSKDAVETLFGAVAPGAGAAAPAARLPRTPHQVRADETTRLVREMTDAASEKRAASTARLRQARLDKEAQDRADAAAAPAPARKARRAPPA